MGLRHGAAENGPVRVTVIGSLLLQWGCGMEPQKTEEVFDLDEGEDGASMGLRHGAAENEQALAGAATRATLQWGCGMEPQKTAAARPSAACTCARFNGAAAWSRRKRFNSTRIAPPGSSLQWGCGMEPQKTHRHRRGVGRRLWLQWGCGMEPQKTDFVQAIAAEDDMLQWGCGMEPQKTAPCASVGCSEVFPTLCERCGSNAGRQGHQLPSCLR